MAKKPEKTNKTAPPPPVDADPEDPKLTRALLARLLWISKEHQQISRQARQLEAEKSQLRDVVFSWLEAHGKTTVKKFGVRVAMVPGRIYTPWKKAFIAALGQEEAQKLIDSSPSSQSLVIESEE